MVFEYFNNLSNFKSYRSFFQNSDFTPVQKGVRKMAISLSLGFGPPRNQNFKPPIDYGRVLNPLRFFLLNLVPGHNYGVFR